MSSNIMTEPETELDMLKSAKMTKEASNCDDHELGITIETYDRKAESKMLRKFDVSLAEYLV